MVGRHEQLRGVGKRLVLSKPARIGMAVRADDRQIAHLFVQRAGQIAGAALGREQAVVVQQCHVIPSDSLAIPLVV